MSGIARGSFQVNATSNEPMDPSDVAVTEDENGGLVVELRAERSGGSKSGRVYHLTVTARDLAGNEVTGTATCTVPHDRARGSSVAGRDQSAFPGGSKPRWLRSDRCGCRRGMAAVRPPSRTASRLAIAIACRAIHNGFDARFTTARR